jgi:hypothetical protein
MVDRSGIHAADRKIEIDAAEHFETGRGLSREKREAGRRVVVVLQHDRAHARRARLRRRFETVERSRHVVGIRVHVDVDRALQDIHVPLRLRAGESHDDDRDRDARHEVYRASGSGRIWKCITLLVVPLPVSMWNGARVLTVAHRPRPFQPPFGSSMRPSTHFV